MEYRTLELIILSANGLKKPRFTGKTDVYAVASISGTVSKGRKQRTSIHKNCDSEPTWNFPMKLIIDEAAGLQNHQTLVVKIRAVGVFRDKNLGEAHVPVKELLESVKSGRKGMQRVSYQVRKKRSGNQKGVVNLSYEVGEKVSGYPAGYGGYGQYPPPPVPGYGGYPPQQVVQPARRSRMNGNGSGMGFGTGLLGGALGGLMLGEIMSGGGGCGGGGCGGGGCGGGGCGGGGCGGGGCGGF